MKLLLTPLLVALVACAPGAPPRPDVSRAPEGESESADAPRAPEGKPEPAEPESRRAAARPTPAPTPTIEAHVESPRAESLERSARSDLDAATRRLGEIDASRLDADQRKRVDVLRGLIDQATEALADGDVPTARSLAEKARLLAEDLTGA